MPCCLGQDHKLSVGKHPSDTSEHTRGLYLFDIQGDFFFFGFCGGFEQKLLHQKIRIPIVNLSMPSEIIC